MRLAQELGPGWPLDGGLVEWPLFSSPFPGWLQVGDPGCVARDPLCPGHCAWLAGQGEHWGLVALLPPPNITRMRLSAAHPLGELSTDLPTAPLPANSPSKGWQSPKRSGNGPGQGSELLLGAYVESLQHHSLLPGPKSIWLGGHRNTTQQLLKCSGQGAAVPV